MARLREARVLGSAQAMSEAEAILGKANKEPVARDLRARVFELAEALFQSVRAQLSVERYQAIAVERGANLDSIDHVFNNSGWLRKRFAEIRLLGDETSRLAQLEAVLHRTDPGPGGFYDDLGNSARQPHLVRGREYAKDPAFLESPMLSAGYQQDLRSSWWDHAEALNDGVLRMRYQDLDRSARYKVRVVYAGDSLSRKIRMTANGIEVHPLISKPVPIKPVEFDIPEQATRGGELTLEWRREPGLGGNGRGCAVSEIWLIKR